jgi:hypothetical protein
MMHQLDLSNKTISLLPGDMIYANDCWLADVIVFDEGGNEIQVDLLKDNRMAMKWINKGDHLLVTDVATYIEEGGFRRWKISAFCGFSFLSTIVFEPEFERPGPVKIAHCVTNGHAFDAYRLE